jgi:DNA-binding NarL/FixJ family response regulator
MVHRVMVVEDHEWLRQMLCAYLGQLADIEVGGAVASAEAAIEGLEQADADLVLVDLSLPGMSGLDLVREVGRRWPAVRCVVLSAHADGRHVAEALAAGACGYVRKNDPQELGEALSAVLDGTRYVSPDIPDWPDGATVASLVGPGP